MMQSETSSPFSLSDLAYRRGSVPVNIRASVLRAASQCGYDQFEEHFLGARVLKIQWVAEASVRAHFPEFLKEPCNFDPNQIVRVDWQTWAIQKRFDGRFEKSVVERVESIAVAVATLLAGEVFTYGLGPEYNWLHWEEGTATDQDLPIKAFDALRDLIESEWRDDVLEYFEEEDANLDGVNPRLLPAVRRVLRARE
jgi:hypothetical protein